MMSLKVASTRSKGTVRTGCADGFSIATRDEVAGGVGVKEN